MDFQWFLEDFLGFLSQAADESGLPHRRRAAGERPHGGALAVEAKSGLCDAERRVLCHRDTP